MQSISQTTVWRKIAQRHDDYINSAWQGIDSVLFSYNNDAILSQHWALKGNGPNWDNFTRNTFYITPTGKIGHQTRENWNAGNWVNNSRILNTYDALDNLTLSLNETWVGGNWQPAQKYEFSGYNSFGNYGEQITSIYTGGTWVYLSRIEQTFQAGTPKFEFRRFWNWDILGWKMFQSLYYTYNQDSVSSITRSVPDTLNSLVSESKIIYNYSGTPLKLQSLYNQYWLADSNKFIDTARLLNTYNANQNLEMTLAEKRIGYNSWTTLTRTLFYYNGGNQLVEKTFEEYSNAWNNKDRYLYSYTGNLLSEEVYYEGFNTAWNLHHKTNFNYDVNENLIFKQRDDFLGSNYVPYSRDFYYYNSFVVGTTDLSEFNGGFVVYPNPAQDRITIATTTNPGSQWTISIYDALGKLRIIRQEPSIYVDFKTEVNLNSLSSGTYFIKVTDEKNKSSVVKIQVK